ncbi:hypothetical protein F442_22057 [Plasmopara halstedii]|uniref:Methyltransferase type 11 domain-containing protein n=1 Tax=Plasmopara halstedii TaxID=4781 RepID=A0A0P1AIX0_PLAHL|nr:hypothetical protein F442_22057 [Plasmopara halstedii]CEG40704.1 hypothetical protein F442_22057 [Plasmopara halstedii]|eukprot:XP_024577073.1 hypothetical protein F442_22057 [Plasmopara halstedii]
MVERLNMVRDKWNNFAVRFTETANKRMTLQCSRHLHSHMQLDRARNILEVAAGAGLGSLDVVQYLLDAEKNLNGSSTEYVEIKCKEANCQELVEVATESIDRYIASLCLQLTPDPDALLREASRVLTPDGIAGFTIWGSPDRSGHFVITSAANKELGFEENSHEHTNFIMGKDLIALRRRFDAAGFKCVQIWPFQCVVELWSAEEFAKFQEDTYPLDDQELNAKRFAIVKRMASEWLAEGKPIGLETYLILARK